MKRLTLALTAMLILAFCAYPALAGKIEDIKSRGVLKAGVKDSQPPFGYVDEASRQIVGFEIDLMAALADKLGVKLEKIPVTSSTRIPMLTQGDVDVVAATMTHTRERNKQIDFSITYFSTQQRLLVKKDSGIKSIHDLAGHKIASAKGSTSEQNATRAEPKATILSFETYPEAFLALKQGKADAVTTDEAILMGIKNKDDNPGAWELVGEPISAEPYGLGVVQNDSQFRNYINFFLMEMWETGQYKKIYDKWFGPDTKYPIALNWTMEVWP